MAEVEEEQSGENDPAAAKPLPGTDGASPVGGAGEAGEDGSGLPVDPRAARPRFWTASTYFAEGFPYTVVNTLPEVLFKEFGASLQSIGLTSLFHLPWNIKFLWGPFLDRYGTKRSWLLTVEVALVLMMAALVVASGTSSILTLASGVFLLLAFLSATHDIAIDGFYLEALDDKEQSKYVGMRAAAYRVAMLVVSGPIVLLIGQTNWTVGFSAATAVMAGLLLWHWRYLPRVETPGLPMLDLVRSLFQLRSLGVAAAGTAVFLGGRAILTSEAFATLTAPLAPVLDRITVSGWIGISLLLVLCGGLAALPTIRRRMDGSDSFYAEAFVDFLSQDKVAAILGFVILFRAGESFLLKMRYAFLRDVGITMQEYGLASGTLGVVASFAGTIGAGYLISKHGLRRWIWPFVIAQNALNLLYAWLAWHYAALWTTPGSGRASFALVSGVIVFESFGAGLGTAVFMVFLMRCCGSNYRAAHMAILTALMSVSFTLAGVASGFMAEAFGFTTYFAFTFLATVPAMALIFVLPNLDEPAT